MGKKLQIIRLISSLYKTGVITLEKKNELAETFAKVKNNKDENSKKFFRLMMEFNQQNFIVNEIITILLDKEAF